MTREQVYKIQDCAENIMWLSLMLVTFGIVAQWTDWVLSMAAVFCIAFAVALWTLITNVGYNKEVKHEDQS